ncbi:MAG TPA: phospholipase C, phosphocholine-specific [Mycobacteriales bacterium]|nr:phospholipase C, phosphocholine-specific [Mycobacteriales bacterium]
MPRLSRRRFLATGAVAAGAAVVGIGSPPVAAAESPSDDALPLYGDLRDIKHIVIVMQENRSFDHYFGRMRGVRGFGDRSTITLPEGLSVFRQPTSPPGAPLTTTQYPWHLTETPPSKYPERHQPPSSSAGAQGYSGTSHNWDDQHGAWAGGWMNGWVSAKSRLITLGYLDRHDIPFHYALAEAYTIGDAYHCSVLSATGPNRSYHWSGTIDAQQKFSDSTAYNGGDEKNLLWPTYAETLQNAGVSWRVYQCIDNFNDNALQYFANFAALDPDQGGAAAPGNPLYDRGVAPVPEPLTGVSANADNLAAAIRSDVTSGLLPQVSWVVSNQVFSEHPDGSPSDGAYLVNGVLNALNADPDVFNSTLVIVNYDENDGQFDHVPPPVAPKGATDEWYRERRRAGYLASFGPTGAVPVGLGFRVPLILVSPWTRGGWVTSEVADHTSVLQLIEKWTTAIGTPALCANISTWRRSVCGDLTGAFDFRAPVYGLPELPPTSATGDPAGGAYQPSPTSNRMPRQEAGTKPARPLPYQPNVNLDSVKMRDDGSLRAFLSMSNNGPHVTKASHFAVYNNAEVTPTFAHYPKYAPSQHTIAPIHWSADKVVDETINLGRAAVEGRYDLTVIGPNRFLRHFTGNLVTGDVTSQAHVDYYPHGLHQGPKLRIALYNGAGYPTTFVVHANHYRYASIKRPIKVRVRAGATRTITLDPVRYSNGWYDVTARVDGDHTWSRRYVGHLETGSPSITGSWG